MGGDDDVTSLDGWMMDGRGGCAQQRWTGFMRRRPMDDDDEDKVERWMDDLE
jgi:hypothetical protein